MFEHLGYFKEFYISNKFIGTLICKKDRETIGYNGRKDELIESRLVLDNGKIIKPNTNVNTILYPLNGRKI